MPQATASSAILYPLISIPTLNSNPGAPATLYLDFHGEASSTWYGTTVPATPAYDTDGDPTTFSAAELSNIQEIWARVSEAYSPFKVNVTTVDPGNWGNGGQHQFREIIGGNGAWTGVTEGGTAYVGSYTASYLPDTAYVFPVNLANGNPQYTADDTVHEAGHGFGLQHQSTWSGSTKTNEYNPGNGVTAPFMGNPLAPGIRATWWYGTSTLGPTNMQDDMAVLANTLGLRSLLYGQTQASATPLSVSSGSFSEAGIIESTTQSDYFSLSVPAAGSDTFNLGVAPYGAMLHGQLELLDSSGNVLADADNASTLGQSITANLAAGNYFLLVKSYGQYGDVGQYTLSGTLPTATAPSTLQLSGSSISVTLNGDYVNTVVDGAASQYSLGLISSIYISGASGSSTSTIDESHGILPSITVSGCAVDLLGSSGSDVVTISDSSIVYDSATITLANVSGITYDDGGGNDNITLAATLPVSLDVSGGNDTISIGSVSSSPSTTSSATIDNSIDNAPSTQVSTANQTTPVESGMSSSQVGEWEGIHQPSVRTSVRAQPFTVHANELRKPANPPLSSLTAPLAKQNDGELDWRK